MTTTQTTSTYTGPRFYIVAGGLTVRGPYGAFPEDCDPATWTTHDSIRICAGGFFRSRAAAKRAASALEDNGVYFTDIIQAANKTEAMNARRAEEQARLVRVGLA